jgi:predicted phosphodiesterase
MTDLIKQISKHMKIYAVRGNHDDENNAHLNQQAFGDAVQWMEDGFEMNGMWFEHGNIIDMYSTPPVAPDGQKKKGFAYFETRAGAEEDGWQCRHKTKRPAGEKEEKYIDFMRKSVELTDKPFFMDKNPATVMWSNWYLKNVVALPQNFVKTHLRWVLKQANPAFKNADYEQIPVMGFGKDQRVEFENQKAEYTLGDAIKDHTYDMELLANKFGSQHALSRLYASGLENHFKWFKASRNHMLVVTGHTHNPYISRMRREKPHHSVSNDIVYANSGAWAQDSYQRDHSSYLDIHMNQLDQPVASNAIKPGEWFPTKVQVYEFPTGTPRDEAAIPFPRKAPGGFDLWLHPDPSELTVGPTQDIAAFTPPKPEMDIDPSQTPVRKPFMANQPLLKHPTPSWS